MFELDKIKMVKCACFEIEACFDNLKTASLANHKQVLIQNFTL